MFFIILFLAFVVSYAQEYIIKVREGFTVESLPGYTIVDRVGNYLLVREREGNNYLQSLAIDPRIEYVARNLKLKAFVTPDDPYYSYQWYLPLMDAPTLWDIRTDCSSVTIAVIDSGVDFNHEDLVGIFWRNEAEVNGQEGTDDDGNGYTDDLYGWDFVRGDGVPNDENGHGTLVTGIIGAVGNNGTGIAGICWSAKIMVLKILDSNGQGTAYDFLKAVKYAVDMGAKVINTSLGTCPVGRGNCNPTEEDLRPLRDAVEYALNAGVVIVAAAGNDGVNTDNYPVYPASYSKDYDNVISVASMDKSGYLSWFSNYGAQTVDIASFGGYPDSECSTSVLSTLPNNRYGYAAGTSIASPSVAAAAALLFIQNPSATPTNIKSSLLNGAVSISTLSGKVRSGGYLNFAKLLGFSFTPLTPTEPFNCSSETTSQGSSTDGGDTREGSGGGGGCNSASLSYSWAVLLFLLVGSLLRRYVQLRTF